MTNATITVFLLSLPLVLLTVLPFGWLRSRMVFLIVGVPIFLIVAVLVFAGLFASQMAAGHGGGGAGGWDRFDPLMLWAALGGTLLVGGALLRRRTKDEEATDVVQTKLPTLREVQFGKQKENAPQGTIGKGDQA
jgi:hypothetical protein